jgi:hypothetical protein
MAGQESVGREIVNVVGFIVGHIGAIVLGLILMILAIGLGVGLVTLPAALPVGIAGFFLLVWGVMGQTTPTTPVPGQPPQTAPPVEPDAAQ